MLDWSLKLFRIRGIQLAVHFSFFLLLAWVAYEGWLFGGWEGVYWQVATLLAFFTCVVLHELGHSFTAMHYGIGVRRILLMPIGGMAEFDTIPREPSRELAITLAGPAVNFFIAAALAVWVGLPWNWWDLRGEFPATFEGFARLLVVWNLLMGLFNLLPVFPMDGGRILRALLAIRLPYLRATYLAVTVAKILAASAVAFCIWNQELLPALLFTFIFLAGHLEYRFVRQREWEDAHWRALLARTYSTPPLLDEPPPLRR